MLMDSSWAVDAGLDTEGLPRALPGSAGGQGVSVEYHTACVFVSTPFLREMCLIDSTSLHMQNLEKSSLFVK